MSLLSRKPVLIILVVVAIPILAFAWWLLSPLFLNTTVSEEFPLSSTADMPTGVTQQEAEDIMEGMAKINMDAVEPMPDMMTEATVLAPRAEFRDGDSFHKGSGDVSLYRLANGDAVLRFEDLDVTNGPDLHVLVSTHPDPMTKGELRRRRLFDPGTAQGQSRRPELRAPLQCRSRLHRLGNHLLYAVSRDLQRSASGRPRLNSGRSGREIGLTAPAINRRICPCLLAKSSPVRCYNSAGWLLLIRGWSTARTHAHPSRVGPHVHSPSHAHRILHARWTQPA